MSNGSEAKAKAIALILVLVIIGFSILFGIRSNPITGSISITPSIFIWSMFSIFLVYISLILNRILLKFPAKQRFCVNCGRNIPFDAVICPYCKYDYEKRQK